MKPQTQIIVDTIVNDIIKTAMEGGTAPWMKPWKARKYVPNCNYESGHVYTGVNAMTTAVISLAKGYTDKRWCTFKQAKDAGLRVRKGEKGTPILHFHFIEKETGKLDEKGKPEIVRIPSSKLFYVFNVQQLDGDIKPDARLNGYKTAEELAVPEWKQEKVAEQVLNNSQAVIVHDTDDKAYYNTVSDSIHLPLKGQFETAAGYYSTALHELAHWTGHKSRLNRFSETQSQENYAREELRAELATWFLSLTLELDFDPQNSQSYIASWLKILENNPKDLFKAASDAEKIKDYLVALSVAENKKAA